MDTPTVTSHDVFCITGPPQIGPRYKAREKYRKRDEAHDNYSLVSRLGPNFHMTSPESGSGQNCDFLSSAESACLENATLNQITGLLQVTR